MNEPQSFATWAITSLGPLYVVLIPLSALVSFLVILFLVYRGRGVMAATSILLLVHVPLMIGVFAALEGLANMYRVMAISGTTINAADIASGYSSLLFAPMVSMLLMIPSYTAALIGTFFRAVFTKEERSFVSQSPNNENSMR